MRLFATGAMSWVDVRALPEDMPIEAKMVTKAIERAQNTVEGRNSEIRKDVLKYDEVMNEQRKVIYAHRLSILEGEDLHDRTVELLETDAATAGRAVVPERVPRGVGPRAPDRRGDAVLPDPVHDRRPRGGDQRRPDRRGLRQRGPRVLRGPLDRHARAARTRPARSSGRSCCRSSTSGGGTTWPRWTT